MQEIIKQIIDKINTAGSILITSHVMPDGDNIGSLLGLSTTLKNAGLDVEAALFDPVPAMLAFLPNSNTIKSLSKIDKKYDLLIALDSSSVERLGVKDLSQYSNFIINIDHHLSNDNFGHINLVYTEYSSTCQIVYEIIKKARYKINAHVATCLYCGLMTDTVGFQTANTNETVFKMAAALAAKGAVPNNICRNLFQNKTMANVLITGKTLSSLNFIYDGLICWGKVEQKTIKEVGGSGNDSFGIVNQMLSIKGVEIAILFHELPDKKVLLDLRSKTVINVNKIAVHFGGGGHLRASGATVEGGLNEVISEVVNYSMEYIKTNYLHEMTKGNTTVDAINHNKPKSSKTNTIRESVGI